MIAREDRVEDAKPELLWIERPIPELIRLAWPIAVSFLSYSTMSLVSTIFVGHLGSAALAGVALGTTTSFALLCFAFGMLRGVKIKVSQAIGAGRGDKADAYLGAGIAIALMLGAIIVAVSLVVREYLPYALATSEAGEHARTYFGIRILAAPMLLTYVALREYRYGIGDSRWPMVGSIAANLANVVLDWFLIFGLDWGVAGAAIATVISHAIEMLVLVVHQRMMRRGRLPTWRTVVEVLSIGWPTGLQFLLEMGSFAMLSFLVASMGDVQMAAHQIGIQVIHFTFLPALSVAEAASVLAGQAVGAGRHYLVRHVARCALRVAGSYALVCTLAIGVLGRVIPSFFTNDAELIHAASGVLWIAMLFQLTDAAGVVASSTLRGAGDVAVNALIGTLCAWGLTPPLTWLLGYHFGLGVMGGWIGLCCEIALASSLYWLRLSRLDARFAQKSYVLEPPPRMIAVQPADN